MYFNLQFNKLKLESKKLLYYLKATDSYIDLTAAFVWTVEHLKHTIRLNNWTSSVSLGPDAVRKELTR